MFVTTISWNIFRLGDGTTSLWYEEWNGKGKIAQDIPYVDIYDVNLRLRDVIIQGAWDCSALYTPAPGHLLEQLQRITPILEANHKDQWSWTPNSTGWYSVKTAYQWLFEQRQEQGQGQIQLEINWLWKLKVTEKIRLFLWLVLHNSIQVNQYRSKCKIANTPNFSRCSATEETILHCQRDSPHSDG